MTLLIYMLVMFAGLGLFLLFTYKYLNPYKLIMKFGKKGCGKSTDLTKEALKHMVKGWTVYSTEPIVGTYQIDPKDIGFVKLVDCNFEPFNPYDYSGIIRFFKVIKNFFFPHKPKILLLVDEVGLIWHCRDFKSFKAEVREFFKMQRHRHIKCIIYSQTFDVDKTIRDLTDSMFLITNVARVFSYGKRIRKFIDIKESSEDGTVSFLAEGVEFEPLLLPGSRSLTFIPRWARFFDSFVDDKWDKMPLHKCKMVFPARK